MVKLRRTLFALVLTGCGGGTSFSNPPIVLSVSVNGATVTVPANGTMVNTPVTIVAPTETATFSITGLPAGVTDTYKESESNPSGLLTLVAISTTKTGNIYAGHYRRFVRANGVGGLYPGDQRAAQARRALTES